jgi:hypothetical protein
MTDTPQLLLAHHLKALKLPTFLREYDKLARQCAAEGLDHVRFLLRLTELELIERERRMVDRRIKELVKARLCGLIIDDQIPEPAIFAVTEHLIREESEYQTAAKRAQEIFQAAANQGGTQSDTMFKPCTHAQLPAIIAESVRLFDCSIVPAMNPTSELGTKVIEELIFESGRPLIVLPTERPFEYSPEIVFVAWDGSRPAARVFTTPFRFCNRQLSRRSSQSLGRSSSIGFRAAKTW